MSNDTINITPKTLTVIVSIISIFVFLWSVVSGYHDGNAAVTLKLQNLEFRVKLLETHIEENDGKIDKLIEASMEQRLEYSKLRSAVIKNQSNSRKVR